MHAGYYSSSEIIEYKLPPQATKSNFPTAKPLPLLNESLPTVEKSERFAFRLEKEKLVVVQLGFNFVQDLLFIVLGKLFTRYSVNTKNGDFNKGCGSFHVEFFIKVDWSYQEN